MLLKEQNRIVSKKNKSSRSSTYSGGTSIVNEVSFIGFEKVSTAFDLKFLMLFKEIETNPSKHRQEILEKSPSTQEIQKTCK
jgi:homoserine kinase